MGSKASTGSWIAAVVVVLAVIGAGVFLAYRARHAEQPPPTAILPAAPSPPSSVAAPIAHPIAQAQASPATASTAPLPALDQSDTDVTAALQRLAGGSELSGLLVQPQLIARIVASIDAMPGRSLGGFMLPAHTPKGSFVTQESDGETVIGAGNAERYAPYMRVIEQVNPQSLVDWYVHAYPLFQQAYRQLGYPTGYFNDRVVTVIDDLLAAPEPARAPALQRSDTGYYVYADPSLESRSAGQRLLLRTGPANEAEIKAKLRAIRRLLVGRDLHPGAASSVSGPARAGTH